MEWADVIDWLQNQGVQILIIILFSLAVYFLISRIIPKTIQLSLKKQLKTRDKAEVDKRAHTLSRLMNTTLIILIAVIAVMMILSELGINIGPVLASLGIVGIAVGFGAQSLVKDILGGLFVIVEDQYDVGDVVKIGGISGVVEDINMRRTLLRDLDGIVHVVPNGDTGIASNYTRDWSRVNLNISVAYGTDLDHAISIINRVCAEMCEEEYWKELIIKTPSVLRVDNLGDSGIEIKILGDTKPVRQWEVTGELRKRIKNVFDEEGIEIPWPHTKIFFGNPLPPTPRGKAVEPPHKAEEVRPKPPHEEHPPETPREFQSPETPQQ